MKRMLIVFAAGLVLFASSAGVSVYLQREEAKRDAEKALANADKGTKAAPISTKMNAPGADFTPPPPLRAAAPSPDNFVQLAASLRQQQETLKTREQNLLTRQKHLELIYQDLKNEQKSLDEIRKQISEEMKTLTDKVDTIDRKSIDLGKQTKTITEKNKEIQQSMTEMDTVEQNRIRQVAAWYDSMDPEAAGATLQQMADSGKMDMAVKILANMQQRQAAKVLTQFPDNATVIQMLDRLKGLKKSGTTP